MQLFYRHAVRSGPQHRKGLGKLGRDDVTTFHREQLTQFHGRTAHVRQTLGQATRVFGSQECVAISGSVAVEHAAGTLGQTAGSKFTCHESEPHESANPRAWDSRSPLSRLIAQVASSRPEHMLRALRLTIAAAYQPDEVAQVLASAERGAVEKVDVHDERTAAGYGGSGHVAPRAGVDEDPLIDDRIIEIPIQKRIELGKRRESPLIASTESKFVDLFDVAGGVAAGKKTLTAVGYSGPGAVRGGVGKQPRVSVFVVSQSSVESFDFPHQTSCLAFGTVPALSIIRERIAVEVQFDEASAGLLALTALFDGDHHRAVSRRLGRGLVVSRGTLSQLWQCTVGAVFTRNSTADGAFVDHTTGLR